MANMLKPLSIIVAVDEDGGFGKDGKIPWNIPEDLKHFKEITSGGICIMGKNTYKDMYNMYIDRMSKKSKGEIDPPEEILPNRKSFVVTKDDKIVIKGATKVKTITEAIESIDISDTREIFVIGGYRMFIEALSQCNKIYMTIVKKKHYNCDRFFPIDILNKKYKIVNGEQTDKLYFITYMRK